MAELIYGFSAARIQKYITASSRLRDIQGASSIVVALCSDRFDQVMDLVGLDQSAKLSAAAGGVRLRSSNEEALYHLYNIWPLLARQIAPGIELHQALVEVRNNDMASALDELNAALIESRIESFVDLPEPGPLVRRSQRTGLAAVAVQENEPVDRATERKREEWQRIRNQKSENAGRKIDQSFLPEDMREEFVFSGGSEEETISSKEDSFVALIHADGNAVGSAVRKIISNSKNKSVEDFQSFSDSLKNATEKAVHDAIRTLAATSDKRNKDGKQILPARPILLGGDDLTILVRANKAMEFTETFLLAFEKETSSDLNDSLESGLSACAGIAYVKESYPFDRAFDLAEALCEQAKKRVKNINKHYGKVPSALAFHKVTSSLPLTANDDVYQKYSMGPYLLGNRSVKLRPRLEHIRALAEKLPKEGKGNLRSLLPSLESSTSSAETALKRSVEILKNSDKKTYKEFVNALKELTGPEVSAVDNDGRTPLLDAIILAEFDEGGSR